MADKTSIIIKSVDQTHKSTSRSITDVSKTATDFQLKSFAQALNATSTNTYTGSSRVQTTDLDNAVEKLPRTLILVGVTNGTPATLSAASLTSAQADTYEEIDVAIAGRAVNNERCSISLPDYTTSHFEFSCIISGAFSDGVCSFTKIEDTPYFAGSGQVTIHVNEDDTYQAADLVITLQGGNS